MFRSRKIQTQLFFSYSLLIVGFILVSSISFYIYISRILENRASESLFQISGHISAEFDAQLKYMNAVSVKILFSRSLTGLFFSDIFHVDMAAINDRRQFNDILYSILGYERQYYRQINMFRLTGEFASFGDDSIFTRISPEDVSGPQWVRDTIARGGSRLITLPHPDDWGYSKGNVISLSRAFAGHWNDAVNSVLEVQQDFEVFARIVRNALTQPDSRISSNTKIYVYREDGALVYPLERDDMASVYWDNIRKAGEDDLSVLTVDNPYTRGKDILAYSRSDFSDWTVTAVQSRDDLFQPVVTMRNAVILLGIAALAVTLLISYYVSRTLTTPIKNIHRSIKFLSLDTLAPDAQSPFRSKLNELEQLGLAFREMRERLQESLEEVITARLREMEANMFALQAQMNPHFLYNMISNISIMAEESHQGAIAEVCARLSGMLRYISSGSTAPVTLQQELDHTLNYLQLMRLRYEDGVRFEIDVPEALRALEVPKLIVQPLAENSMKYAIHADPPWVISIRGHDFPDRWELEIRDNGPGFAEPKLRQLKAKLASAHPMIRKPYLQIDGMGILNIYIRLKLFFDNRAEMELGNHPAGGAVVTIVVRKKL